MGTSGSKIPTGGKGSGKTGKGKGGGSGNLPGGTQVQITMTAQVARDLLRALTLNQALTGPSANVLITEISRVLLSIGPKNGKKKNGKTKNGKNPVVKSPVGPQEPRAYVGSLKIRPSGPTLGHLFKADGRASRDRLIQLADGSRESESSDESPHAGPLDR